MKQHLWTRNVLSHEGPVLWGQESNMSGKLVNERDIVPLARSRTSMYQLCSSQYGYTDISGEDTVNVLHG